MNTYCSKVALAMCFHCFPMLGKRLTPHYHIFCSSVILAWWNTFHSELIIHLHRHPSIYIGFLFYCMSPEAKGCQMKLFSFCILLNYRLSQKLQLLGNGEFNYLTINLTLSLTCGPKLPLNKWGPNKWEFNILNVR